MNSYETLTNLKTILQIATTDTTQDALLLSFLEAASREVEGPDVANRVFYPQIATRYYDGRENELLLIDDLISATEIAEDDTDDFTWATALISGTDYVLTPENEYPKTGLRCLYDVWAEGQRRYKITGTWGFLQNAWKSAGVTGTVATASGTSLTLSAAGGIAAGHTLLLDAEQVYVTAVSGTTATIERAVNGTTAATHTTAAVSIAQYPEEAKRAALWFAVEAWKTIPNAGLGSQTIGEYAETFRLLTERQRGRMVGRIRRPSW